MAITPQNSYPVTGVVDTTAKAELAAHFATLKALYAGAAAEGGFTDGDQISPQLKQQSDKEIDAVAAGVAASPSV